MSTQRLTNVELKKAIAEQIPQKPLSIHALVQDNPDTPESFRCTMPEQPNWFVVPISIVEYAENKGYLSWRGASHRWFQICLKEPAGQDARTLSKLFRLNLLFLANDRDPGEDRPRLPHAMCKVRVTRRDQNGRYETGEGEYIGIGTCDEDEIICRNALELAKHDADHKLCLIDGQCHGPFETVGDPFYTCSAATNFADAFISPSEFLDSISEDGYDDPFFVVGFAKKRQESTDLLVSNDSCSEWTEIPISMIAAVKVISPGKRDERLPKVILRLNTLRDTESLVYSQVFRMAITPIAKPPSRCKCHA